MHFGRDWPGSGVCCPHRLVAIGGKADAARSRANDAIDPERHFTIANCRIAKGLFDHFVGRGKNCLWDGQVERLGSLEINHHLKFCWLLNWQVARLFPLEDAIDV